MIFSYFYSFVVSASVRLFLNCIHKFIGLINSFINK